MKVAINKRTLVEVDLIMGIHIIELNKRCTTRIVKREGEIRDENLNRGVVHCNNARNGKEGEKANVWKKEGVLDFNAFAELAFMVRRRLINK